jgi:antitoxin FitA
VESIKCASAQVVQPSAWRLVPKWSPIWHVPAPVHIPNGTCAQHVQYAFNMPTMVQIRNVSDELLHELKARAAAQRMSLSDFLLARLAEIAEEPALDDVLDRLAALPRRDLGASAAELVGEARSE